MRSTKRRGSSRPAAGSVSRTLVPTEEAKRPKKWLAPSVEHSATSRGGSAPPVASPALRRRLEGW